MKIAIHALAVLALGTGAPVAASDLAEGEIALRINAQGSVPADYAIVEMRMTGSGKTRAEAEAALRKRVDEVSAFLATNGIAGSAVMVAEPVFEQTEKFDWQISQDDRSPIVALQPVPPPLATVAPPPRAAVPAPPRDASNLPPRMEIQSPVAAPASREPPLKVTVWEASSAVKVEIDDLGRLADLGPGFRSSLTLPFRRPSYGFRDEAKAQRDAVAAAMAKARSDADIHAEVMGYKVVRIASVSNDGPPLSLPAILQTIGALTAAGTNALQELGFPGQKVALVSVEFVIAPK